MVYLEHQVNHPVPKVSFATGWLATGTNTRQPATPVPLASLLFLVSTPVTLESLTVSNNHSKNSTTKY